MKEAVGTSLVIIAAKSLIGFFGESGETVIDYFFLAKVPAFPIAGIFIGLALSKKIDGSKLKPAFGWFGSGHSHHYQGNHFEINFACVTKVTVNQETTSQFCIIKQ